MNPTLTAKSRFRAMGLLWGYAVFKFWIASAVLAQYGINPWIFLVLDTVTVPPYVIGWNLLIAAVCSKRDPRPFRTLVLWAIITFVSSTAPYFYAAWAGRQSGSKQAWIAFVLILALLLIGQIRKLCRAGPL
jgi:hypothetical protein